MRVLFAFVGGSGHCEPLVPVAVAAETAVRDTVTAVLAGASYRRKAERMRDEIASLPDSATAVVLLEQLLSEKRPLLSNWPQPRKL